MHTPLATGIVKDTRFLEHHEPSGHPESHQRLEAVYSALQDQSGMVDLIEVAPRAARRAELAWVHSDAYIQSIAATANHSQTSLTADTYASQGSYQAALLAVGGLLEAVDKVASGALANAFALIRPPGHHAEQGRAMGYCLFNNVALAAMFARKALGLHRILIVDWDVHHGNGIQHCFETDPSVLYFSSHQQGLFPGTGAFLETGMGRGEGYTINIPLPRGYGDAEFAGIFEQILRPLTLAFEPQLILVSAGFDTHRADPLGNMRMSPAGFAGLTRSLMDLAEQCCGGKLVLALEGGYNIEALAASISAVLKELTQATRTHSSDLAAAADPKKLAYALKRTRHVHNRYWKCL